MGAIETVLVANRGEIAVRVMRAAKVMGLKTVAVYSDADAKAMHTRSADIAVPLGGMTAAESYLNIEAILEAARKTNADAIHPGYGFLSENTAFAAACSEANVLFIGPPASAVKVMGDKALAKRAMLSAGVPCIPGYQGEDQSDETLTQQIQEMGLPVMVKAAAGGGGRGMRLVQTDDELLQAIELARSEAERAFGNSDLIIESAIKGARHVEVQVFADNHGNVIHLGERDCSLQRRHQKIVEESPCPVMTTELRQEMGMAAVEAARAVEYVGAGTVEFLLDAKGNFFFLEMNTRLQVEHPVTEAVTGFDLVQWQIRIAQGEPLPAVQDDVDLFGHAIEVRLCAEDTTAGFLPSSGPVSLFNVPQTEGLRVDTGIETGDIVSPFYDSMVAKIIAWGETREEARLRLCSALRGTALIGVAHNREFLMNLLSDATFINGLATTDFVDQHYRDGFKSAPIATSDVAAAISLQHIIAAQQHFDSALSVSSELRGWVSTGASSVSYRFEIDGTVADITIETRSATEFAIYIADDVHTVLYENCESGLASLLVDGDRKFISFHAVSNSVLEVSCQYSSFTVTNLDLIPPENQDTPQGGRVTAPMHGQVISLLVEVNQKVECGQRLAVFEAMKMQHEILAPVSGVIRELNGRVGKQMAAGDIVMVIEEEDSD